MLIQEGSLEVAFDSDFEIDPELPQRQIDHFKGRVADARHRDMLENFRSHMYQEMIGLGIQHVDEHDGAGADFATTALTWIRISGYAGPITL